MTSSAFLETTTKTPKEKPITDSNLIVVNKDEIQDLIAIQKNSNKSMKVNKIDGSLCDSQRHSLQYPSFPYLPYLAPPVLTQLIFLYFFTPHPLTKQIPYPFHNSISHSQPTNVPNIVGSHVQNSFSVSP